MQVVTFGQAKITIATSTTVSSVIDLTGRTLEAIITPDITSTAVRFQAAIPSTQGDTTLPGTYFPLTDSAGNPYEVTVADLTWTTVDHDVFAGVRWLKLVFQSAEAADRTITLALGCDR